ncbi:MAG: lytic transglycosylase domain-containing protein, partial [Acidobacteria bacterium]|nr:lytic transglycosylase domain-containing protein [Acidobacteriota bacterium]
MNQRDRYDSLFQFYAEKFGMPACSLERFGSMVHWRGWEALKAQALAESAGNPDAISPAKAMGLTQFMAATWREWWDGTPGIQGEPRWNPYNPEAAIRAQAAYM